MDKFLFEIALQIQEPLYLVSYTFDEKHGLHVYIDFREGAHFDCQKCGSMQTEVHDTKPKTWRHLDFFQYKCYIHFRTPRVDCYACGIYTWTPPWAQPGSKFTEMFERFVMMLANSMPVTKIAIQVREHDTRLWRIIKRYVNIAYKVMDFSNLVKVGIDETSSQKGHKYISVFSDMETGNVVFATPGKHAETVKEFADELILHNAQASQIKHAAMDMSGAYISGLPKYLPNAEITFDKFHVIQLLNRAVDEVRREECRGNVILKGSRQVWLKNPGSLTVEQAQQLETLSKENLKTSKAYQMKLTLQDIYQHVYYHPAAAVIAIKKWLRWADRSRLEPIKVFAKTIKTNFDGVINYFYTRLTSGLVEGINSRIQEIKRRARGFRNTDNYIAMVYLVAGGLDIPALY